MDKPKPHLEPGLTRDEVVWIKKMQRALNSCPSKRLGFFTIGDVTITIYDASKMRGLETKGTEEFSTLVDRNNAYLGSFEFPNNIDSVAG